MVCADLLAGAHLQDSDTGVRSAFKVVQVSTGKSAASVSADRKRADPMKQIMPKQTPIRLEQQDYLRLREQVLRHCGADDECNLITLCCDYHSSTHGYSSGRSRLRGNL